MARVEKRISEKKGTVKYRITVYKGYLNGKQKKETSTYTLDEMGISALSDKGNPRAESTIMKEVQLYADNLEKRVSGANYLKGDKVSFATFYENTWKPWAEEHFSASTYYSYTRHIDTVILPELGSLKIGKISPEYLSVFYLKLAKGGRFDGKEGGYSRCSIVAFHKHICSIMGLAKQYKLIEENPCNSVTIPKKNASEKIKYLTKEQAQTFVKMLENPSPCVVKAFYNDWGRDKITVYDFCAREETRLQYNTFKTLFRVALSSGCRIGELNALRWKDIDFNNDSCVLHITKAVSYAKGGKYIKEPKNKSSYRDVPIPKEEIPYLKALKSEQKQLMLRLGSAWKGIRDPKRFDENLVFPQLSGDIMNRSAPNKTLHRLITNYNADKSEKDKLPNISIHCLRHTHATLLLIEGKVDIKTVSARLGHKNVQTTLNIYSHALPSANVVASNVFGSLVYLKEA